MDEVEVEQCFCDECGGEFFKAYAAENGANLVVCCDCGEVAMCFYELGSGVANDG